jgi:PAS domain S-box-containing protein
MPEGVTRERVVWAVDALIVYTVEEAVSDAWMIENFDRAAVPRRNAMADPSTLIGFLAEGIVQTVREPLLVLDEGLRVVTANQAFYQAFEVIPQETEDTLVYELGNRQWDIPELRKLLEELLPEHREFRDLPVAHDFPQIGSRTMLLNARQLVQEPDQPPLILLAIEDITARKQAEEALIEAKELNEVTLHSIGDGVITTDADGVIRYLNPVAEKLTGWGAEEAQGQPVHTVFRIVREEDREPVQPEWAGVLHPGLRSPYSQSRWEGAWSRSGLQ